jgi:hypothetical protein
MSDSVVKYVDLMNYLDREMDKISGISPERQGAVQGASQGLGVQQTALFQSNLITQPYFIGFERFCSRVLNHQAKLAKISWAEGNDVFAPVIGDVGVDFLREHVDLDFEDFAAFSESIPPLIRDREKFESLVMIAVQSDPTFIDEAIQILMEQDTRVAVRRFQRRRAMQKVYMAQEQQASEERQAALEERLKGLEMQGRQMEIDGRLEETQMKNEAGQLKTSSTGRTKLSDTSIKTHVDLLKHQQTLRSQEKQQKEQNEIKRQEIIARNREKSKQQRKTNAKK